MSKKAPQNTGLALRQGVVGRVFQVVAVSWGAGRKKREGWRRERERKRRREKYVRMHTRTMYMY